MASPDTAVLAGMKKPDSVATHIRLHLGKVRRISDRNRSTMLSDRTPSLLPEESMRLTVRAVCRKAQRAECQILDPRSARSEVCAGTGPEQRSPQYYVLVEPDVPVSVEDFPRLLPQQGLLRKNTQAAVFVTCPSYLELPSALLTPEGRNC